VVMESAPSASLVVTEPKFLLEILVVAFDAPAQLGRRDQRFERGGGWQGSEEVFGRFWFAGRPFDQEPFFWTWCCAPAIAMRRSDAECGKARSQSSCALAKT